MNKYKQFIFESYKLDKHTKLLELRYSYDGVLYFSETYHFDFDFTDYNQDALDRAIETLFYIAGISYFKAYMAPEIVIKQGTIDETEAKFLSETYQRGLGEFFYVNKLDPTTQVIFPVNEHKGKPTVSGQLNNGLLVGLGGGKDSIVSVELLRDNIENVATWSLNHRKQLTPLTERVGLPHFWVERNWDKKLLELNSQDALNGHIPISAIIAAVGSVTAILTGRRDVVVSNEQSANEPTLQYEGVDINHQYSKSQDFESNFQSLLNRNFGQDIRYYSFLRPLSEVFIAELFSIKGFNRYKDVFSSCNRAFTHESNKIFWDGTCPKCAFFFLAMTPFTDRESLEELFSGKNILLDPKLEQTYRQLLGISGDKPLECVGEIEESRQAMFLSTKIYPELAKLYKYELPEDYDYQALSGHTMPEELYDVLLKAVRQSGFEPRSEQI